MSNKTFVWVVEYNDADGDIDIGLFLNEKKAYQVAIDEALEYMKTSGCDENSAIPGWADAYKKIIRTRENNHTVALDAYNDWNHNLVTDELSKYEIYVYLREVNEENESAAITSVKAVVPVDVPCKQCGRKVNDTESSCWYCGVANPSKR